MKTRNLHFSAKLRQYRYLAKRLDRALQDGSFKLLSQNRQRQLLRKLKERLRRIAPIVSEGKMKNALAGLAMLMATGAGAQSFGPPITSPFGLPNNAGGGFFAMADLDGDGDEDLFNIGYVGGNQTMRFYENTGTPESPVFSADNFIENPFGILPGNNTLFMLDFADLDNDGDFDLMVGDFFATDFFFFENTGTPTSPAFGAAQTNPFGLTPVGGYESYYTVPAFVDMDGDGDLDLFATTYYAQNAYYENVGTLESPNFSAPISNPFGIDTGDGEVIYAFPDFEDLDNDGDPDLLYANLSYDGGVDFFFVENEGTAQAPAFAIPASMPFGLSGADLLVAVPKLVDIDNDGDFDIFSLDYDADSEEGFLVFFENLDVSEVVPPTSADVDITTTEDEPYFFSAADFPFFDGNLSDQLQAVQITALPTAGSFTLNGAAVAVNDIIGVDDLANLGFFPVADEFGDNYAAFQFRVSDGMAFSADNYTLTVDVTPVNDFPASEDAAIDILASETYVFGLADFPFSDIDGDTFAQIQIVQTVDKGTLALDGAPLTNGQIINATQVGQLAFTPIFGEEGIPYTSFVFRVSDGQVFTPVENTMTINITGPNATRENTLEADVLLSPNPASEMFKINVFSDVPLADVRYAIYDAAGRKIISGKIVENGTEITEAIPVGYFSEGLYYVKIMTGEKSKVVKFVKG